MDGGRPEFESYRYALWQLFVRDSVPVDFIGSRTDDACYSPVAGYCFDTDHEGTGGDQTTDVLEMLASTNFSHAPDIVTLGIGGNDLIGERSPAETAANVGRIIDELQALNDSLLIVLEQVPPGRSDFMMPELTAAFADFNARLPAIANAKATVAKPVVVVDMAAGWSDDYMADIVHYNVQGAQVVAERYYAAIDSALKD